MAGPERSAPPALSPPPGNPRFPLFDGLRAIAALSVLVYHAGFYSRASESHAGLAPYLARLNVGVAVFFLISGFLLYRPLVAARTGDGPPVRLRDYGRRRALRIVPAYWVALTVLAVYPGLRDVFSGNWWVQYGFAQGYDHAWVLGGIGPAWTLGAEVVFYALLPVLSLAFDRGARLVGLRVWWQLEVAALSVLVAASAVYRAHAFEDPVFPPATFGSTFGWFALGMVLALASVLWSSSPRPWLGAAARYAWVGWPIAAGAYVLMCAALGLRGGNVLFERQSGAQAVEVYLLSGIVAVGLALPAALEREARSPVGRLLAWPPLAWLGLISYGIYLYHEPIANALNGGFNSAGNPTLRLLWLAPALAALAIAAGALSYYLVERPILRLKDRRASGPAAPRPAIEAAR